jgi:hypothetical protein
MANLLDFKAMGGNFTFYVVIGILMSCEGYLIIMCSNAVGYIPYCHSL